MILHLDLAFVLLLVLAESDGYLGLRRNLEGPGEEEVLGRFRSYINYRARHQADPQLQRAGFDTGILPQQQRLHQNRNSAPFDTEDTEIDGVVDQSFLQDVNKLVPSSSPHSEFRSNTSPQRTVPSPGSPDLANSLLQKPGQFGLQHRGQEESVQDVVQNQPWLTTKEQRASFRDPQTASLLGSGQSQNVRPVESRPSDIYFIALVAGCSGAAVFGVIAAGFCWYRLQKGSRAAAEAEYPAYGVTGPSKDHPSPPSGDRKLAQSAQMYHYQHQKQQMIALEKASSDRHVSTSDLDSEEENEEGDYTVYECPGLAPTGEMEVKNPLFQDEPTPASPPIAAKLEPEK